MKIDPYVALLAPVPLVHLEDGMEVCRNRRLGKVAFGSRAWELFRKLDAMRRGLPVHTFIYASHADSPERGVTWHAYYTGHVESRSDGTHPDGEKYRPPSTRGETGHWAVFWEVEGLERMPLLEMSELRGLNAGKNYDRLFIPEGPMLIEHP